MRLIDADALVGGTYYVSQNERFVGYTQQDIDDTPTVKHCENAVSREAVLNGLANIAKAKAKSDAQKALMGRVMYFIEQLPSVYPERPKGKWMECGGDEPWLKGYCCSLCNFTATNKYNYCPDCGAEMGGGE